MEQPETPAANNEATESEAADQPKKLGLKRHVNKRNAWIAGGLIILVIVAGLLAWRSRRMGYTKQFTIEGWHLVAVQSDEIAGITKGDPSLEKTNALATGLRKLDGTIKQNNLGDHEIDALRKELEPERDYLRKIREQQLMYELDKSGEQRVRVMEETYISRNQNLNKKLLLAIGTALGSFVFVVLVVGLLEWRNRRIDGVDQVVNDLGMRIIGTVPAFPSRANIKAASEGRQANWRFILNESINSTRTMLLHSARNQQMQVVMITSATQGEGKTSLASQLGTSMATAGMRTLIVDCDLRNPSINKLFDLKVTPGVSEVLMQEVDVSDAVQPTSVPNLWVIPAGQCSNRVIAALAQGHPLETLFNRLRGQFDFILVDSCPVLPVADALLIGQHVDGVLFSIMQDVSQIPKVISASEKLAQLNILLLGAVVNGIRNDVYSYGYNYVKQLPA